MIPLLKAQNYDLRNSLTPKRVTNAMWDFSWLQCHYPGGAFEDFDKVTDELLDRKFNTVRIESFPWIIGRLKSEDESITIPGSPLESWGFTDLDRKHVPVKELVEFMTITKQKGIYVILSTWGWGCNEYPSAGESKNNPDGEIFRKGWERILEILSARNLLEHVLYVDCDQEFPYFSYYKTRLDELGAGKIDGGVNAMDAAGRREDVRGLAWNAAQLAFVRDLFSNTLKHFQSLYPGLRFTFSLTGFWEEVRSLHLKSMDVLELHCWIHSPRFDSRTGFNELVKDRGEHDYRDYQRRIDQTLKSIRPMLLREMHNRLAFASEWAKEIAAPLIATEAWGPWWHMDHNHLRWDWLREWCAECMNLAAEYGFWGVTPWNYSHPYWKNWSDLPWYREVNGAFLKRR